MILQEIMYLFNYEPAISFTDFRTTAEFKYIQHLQNQEEQVQHFQCNIY